MELIHVSGNTDCLLGKTAVGIYRIDDTRCILFDNGYSKEYDELVGSLKDAGLTPAGLIVSHAHIDHHGNSKRLREAFQIPLAMSLGEAGLIASQAALERYTNYFGRSEEEKISIDTEQRCPVDCIIQPEDTSVTLCGVTFPVHHLPGHSLDHIVIGTPDGVCFAGDALLTENVLRHVKLPYCDHVGLDLESKEAITKLPYQHWILSHKGPFDGNIRELADKNMDLVRLRLAELAKLLQRPMTLPLSRSVIAKDNCRIDASLSCCRLFYNSFFVSYTLECSIHLMNHTP